MKRYLACMGTTSAILGCAAATVPDVPLPIPKRLFSSLLYGQKVPRRAVSAGNEAIEELCLEGSGKPCVCLKLVDKIVPGDVYFIFSL